MNDQFCENDKSLEITAEHAVLIPSLPAIKSVMDYVEAVAVVIGSCHIHSVFEENENIKIYLNDKRFVDILVNNGVSILGRRMNVDYVVPRADKVLLSNVDPIIPDAVLMKLLCFYGSPVSAIIHEKIATNSEYSHIECGKRKVYLKIHDDKKVPTKINFTYQDVCYQIDVLVEPTGCEGTCEPIENPEQEAANEDLIDVESNQSLKPYIHELQPIRQPTPKQLAYRNRGKRSPYSASYAARQIKIRARKGWYGARKVKRLKGNKGRGTNRVLNDTMHSPPKKLRRGSRGFGKARRGGKHGSISNTSVPNGDMEIANDEVVALDQNGIEETLPLANGPVIESLDMSSVSQYPLTHEELETFLSKTRFHRDPLQVAMELLHDDKTPDVLEALRSQLLEYHQVSKEQSLKLRIKRLMLTLKSVNEEIVE